MQHDVIIIGGSYAGLSAGLQLARARRAVLVIDSGQRRNRFAITSHGFVSRDGASPAQIAEAGRAQLLAYPSVQWADGQVIQLRGEAEAFEVTLADGSTHTARRLVLAMGVVDRLPALAGLAERWGTQVFACPYCHGYELGQGRIGVLATSAFAVHQAAMLPDWGATQLFLNDAVVLDEAQHAHLQARGVHVACTWWAAQWRRCRATATCWSWCYAMDRSARWIACSSPPRPNSVPWSHRWDAAPAMGRWAVISRWMPCRPLRCRVSLPAAMWPTRRHRSPLRLPAAQWPAWQRIAR